MRGCGQHDKCKRCIFFWRYLIVVCHKFKDSHASIGTKALVDFFKERNAGVLIEVVEDIGQDGDVERTPKVCFECITRKAFKLTR